ncbi:MULTISPECIES: hypothetical protein [unclassified Brevundimonas]|uniref:hypothetical protein n=1 Tax=unclassified Brevundimonas TaxID=2622653 RepID=UPI000CFAED15|nr:MULTISPECIES: hypothetical protein [unclassified Brevundimonas]PRA30955.1 hypothetical protein CQ024_07445 [Brevundimonas sp. MYb27]PQZ82898.1 hypothetical protein CQ026_07435 [Brevundimonas sp. MYb31]PRB17072.1 hypothetical protein CQ039_03775 [Brevundimonas sp. MYb52]PRB34756.1 hypothetical protein CQ035_09955 [Brevundimonas sp. MYb46]PRB54793.1 hypothetical protein CQ028_04260 [Brevundimonas sp. MYb33]
MNSWSELTLSQLLLAYRKAKSDCFYERSLYAAERFTEYESNLCENLESLLVELRSGFVASVFERSLGEPRIFAKSLSKHQRSQSDQNHSFFSDTERAFERLIQQNHLVPEFRLVGDFLVEMHILSALWLNQVGHRYDQRLANSAYGSRVRRYGARGRNTDLPEGEYQYDAIGSFEPYFSPYKSWRDSGVSSIRNALSDGQAVVAITLDFSSYYHNIDPSFMVHPDFLSRIGLNLSEWDLSFTRDLVSALHQWGGLARDIMQQGGLPVTQHGGLPIGLSAVRIITNVLLCEFDRQIQNGMAPLYYGRYVDDIFLVIPDPGNVLTTQQLWAYVQSRVSYLTIGSADEYGESGVEVRLGDYQGLTRLRFQPSKQKVFFLSGQSGLDLLNNIAHQIRSLSSERRLMPLLDELDTTASARALSAADSANEEPDSLRRADGLTLRRLGWALQLRSVEILARDLERSSWRRERRSFYEFARAHILRPDKILEQLDYLARLISLAVSLGDWSEARQLLSSALSAIDQIERANAGGGCKINGVELPSTPPGAWRSLREWVLHSCREAVLRSLPWNPRQGSPHPLSRDARRMLTDVLIYGDENFVFQLALAVREADWAKVPYKEHLRLEAGRQKPRALNEERLYAAFPHLDALQRFLVDAGDQTAPRPTEQRISQRCRHDGGAASLLPFIVPTRPYSAQEVALYHPEDCVFGEPADAARNWGEYVRAVRGVWPRFTSDSGHLPLNANVRADGEVDPRVAVIGGVRDEHLRLGITSLETSDESWSRGASGSVDLSSGRYNRLVRIVNLAIQSVPRPTHLLLPELSLPDRWLYTVSSVLQQAGISLIAGLDYTHFDDGTVSSSAVLVLSDDRLGYPSSVQIRQQKLQPAPGEEESLYSSHGKTWRSWTETQHPIYMHNGYYFGLLICSELQNVEHRSRFQGHVDWIGVLSWNRDIETFSSLVESASLDVHAYIALVNNRRYGDSRVRSPRKASFARDVCRIRGGMNEHLVVVQIDPTDLRAQQSRAHRWARPSDRYKPAPEGFRISPSRRTTPS